MGYDDKDVDYDPRALNRSLDKMKFGSVRERIMYKRKLMGLV